MRIVAPAGFVFLPPAVHGLGAAGRSTQDQLCFPTCCLEERTRSSRWFLSQHLCSRFGPMDCNPSHSRRILMLVLARRPGETIVIDGDVRITVVEAKGNCVRLGIEAP